MNCIELSQQYFAFYQKQKYLKVFADCSSHQGDNSFLIKYLNCLMARFFLALLRYI